MLISHSCKTHPVTCGSASSISSNVCSRCISPICFLCRTVLLPQIEQLYRVSDNANAVTVLVVLHDSNLKLVLKALPAARAVDACRQVRICRMQCHA